MGFSLRLNQSQFCFSRQTERPKARNQIFILISDLSLSNMAGFFNFEEELKKIYPQLSDEEIEGVAKNLREYFLVILDCLEEGGEKE